MLMDCLTVYFILNVKLNGFIGVQFQARKAKLKLV